MNFRPSKFWIAEINFLHYAVLLFVACTAVLVLVSLATPAPDVERFRELTFGTPAGGGESSAARRRDIALSAGLVAVLAWLWIAFR